jgi:hypothetical protein
MADTVTPNYGWVKPQVGGDGSTWGATINNDLDLIDAQVFSNQSQLGAVSSVVQAPNVIGLTAPNGTGNLVQGSTNGSVRWQLLLGNGASETGGNVGSDFALAAFSDTAGYLSEPITIARSSGLVSMSWGLNVGGPGISTPSLNATNGAIENFSVYGNATVNGALTVGANVQIDNGLYVAGGALSANGAVSFGSSLAVGANVQINNGLYVAGGATTLNATLLVGGAVTCNSTLNAAGGITGSAFGLTDGYTALYSQNLTLYPGLVLNGGGGSFSFSASSGSIMEADPGGQLGIYGQAYKPGGGPWINSSDARIKTVQGPYELGLNEILDLKPVVYRFKGNDAAPGKQSRTAADRSFVGLVAQEVESVFPGMVTRRKGHIDGREVDDLRDLDTNELIFALVNAVKTLAAEVAELKAR